MATFRLRRLFFLLAALMLLAAALHAQTDADDDDDAGPPTATLSVRYDARGAVGTELTLNQPPADWSALETALEQAVHCPAGSLRPGNPWPQSSWNRIPISQRQMMQQMEERAEKSTRTGGCLDAMRRDRLLLSTHLNFQPLLLALRPTGEQKLWITVYFPESVWSSHSHTVFDQPVEGTNPPERQLSQQFDVAQGGGAAMDLVFGTRQADLLRQGAISGAFLLLPIVVTLWMRRAALRDAQVDPTAAWFSYFRVLTWSGTGLFLLWVFDSHVREGLETPLMNLVQSHGDAATALGVVLVLLPPWLSYLICALASWRVYVEVRGDRWTRGHFYASQLSQIGSQMLPLMLVMAGLSMFAHLRVAVALFASAYFSSLILRRLVVHFAGLQPQPLTTGDLRDRVFALAKTAGVDLQQIYVLPAGKSQMANAFASRNRVVMFTDYLLERLSRREVTAVAAHEITHVRKNHVAWKWPAFGLLIFSPMIAHALLEGAATLERRVYFWWIMRHHQSGIRFFLVWFRLQRATHWLQNFAELDLIAFTAGFLIYHLVSRVMERSADKGALELTGDPEAVITSLLKLTRLNLMPVQWGRVTGSIVTHPSTLRRVERIAKLGNLPPNRLQELLHGSDPRLSPLPDAAAPEPDRFAPAPTQRASAMKASKAARMTQPKYWILLGAHFVPAILIQSWVLRAHVQPRLPLYLAGGLLCVLFYVWITHWVGGWGRAQAKSTLQAQLRAEGLAPGERDLVVGLSPDAESRRYAHGQDWDYGYLLFTRDRLVFLGEEIRFAVAPDQVSAIRAGSGFPAWFPVPRVLIDVTDPATGAVRTWSFSSLEPCHFWHWWVQVADLQARLSAWKSRPADFRPTPSSLESLSPPAIGAVTSQDPRIWYRWSPFLRLLMRNWVFATILCIILTVPLVWFVAPVVLAIRVYESLPYWLSRAPARTPEPVPAGAV
jgi:Zn-dependent protease with chaperone function